MLAGKTAVVTGGAKGIGKATAALLVQRGARLVVGVARNLANLQAAATATGMHHVISADLSERSECERVVQEILQLTDRIDILVCNHGIGIAHETELHLQDPAAFELSMRTNLEGPFYLTRAILPVMVQQRYGRCVYVSSMSALMAEPRGVGYNTSKAGLNGLMRSVSVDGGPYEVTANAVLPGWVRTELAERSAADEAGLRGISVDEVWKERAAIYPPKRVVEPEEVAHTILFLASQESRGVSGQSIGITLGGIW